MIILGKSGGAARSTLALLIVSLGLSFAAPAVAQTTPAAPAKPAGTDKPATPAPPKPPAAPGAAAPAAKPGDAKGLLASADKKFKASDYAGALADYEASNSAKASPEAQRGIAMSHDNLQHFTEAVTAYEKFIADNPPKKDQAEEAKKRVEAIKAMPGKIHIETTPAGASIVIDASQTPYEKVTPVDLELPSGKHTLLIGAEGYENATKEIDVGYASKQDVKADLTKKEAPPPPPPVVAEQPPPPPTPPPPPPPEPRSKVPAYVTGAVAIVAAGVGTGFGIKALGQSSDFKSKPTTKLADDGENNALVADMMFGIAITFGVTSAVLFLSNDAPSSAKAGTSKSASAPKKPSSKPRIIPVPYVTSTGGGASALFRF
jgi:hypothetical protein